MRKSVTLTPEKVINGEVTLREWYADGGLNPSLGEKSNIYQNIRTIAMTNEAYYFLDNYNNIHMRLPHNDWERVDLDGRFHFISRQSQDLKLKRICDDIYDLDVESIQVILTHLKDRLEVLDHELKH